MNGKTVVGKEIENLETEYRHHETIKQQHPGNMNGSGLILLAEQPIREIVIDSRSYCLID
jgi:hypothetical protein